MTKLSELMKAEPKEFIRILRSKPTEKVVEDENEEVDSSGFPAINYKPTLPRINVLPDEITAKYETAALARKFGVGVIAAAVLVCATFGGGVLLNMQHQKALAGLDGQTTQLQSDITALQPFQLYKDGVEAKRTSLSTALTSDVDMASILDDLNSQAGNNNVTFDTVDVSLSATASADTAAGGAAATGGECFNPDPFSATATIGCITLSGNSSNKDEVTGFFNGLDSTDGFVNSFISSVTNTNSETDGNTTQFNGSISITSVFYSGDFADLAAPLDQIIGGGTGETGVVAASLQSEFPAVFPPGYAEDTIVNATNNICSGLTAGGTYENALSIVSDIAASSGADADEARDKEILSTVVTSVCPTNTGILEG